MDLKSIDFSSLKTRFLSSLILGPVTIAIILYGGYPFLFLACLAGLIALKEWVKTVTSMDRKYLWLIFGLLYLTASFAAFIFMRFAFPFGGWLVLCLCISVWGGDIGAYFAGKFIGGPKLLPSVSPNKTWAGLAGAMISSGVCLVLMHMIGLHAGNWFLTDLGIQTAHLPFVFTAGLLFGIAGQAGDFLMSFVKRKANAKDFSGLIPGHGGILDRIDALLLVCPIFLGTYMIIMGAV